MLVRVQRVAMSMIFTSGFCRAPVEHAGEQDRVHLGHVVPPEDEHVGVVEVLVAAHRLVESETRQEAADGAGHAQPGIGLEVVAADAGLHALRGGVAIGDGPLAGAVHRHGVLAVGLDRLGHLRGHQVESVLHRHRDELAVLPNQGLGEPILAVESHHRVVALDAAETLVDRARGVALDRHRAAPVDAHKEPAPDATEAARRLLPLDRRRARRVGRRGEQDAWEHRLGGADRRRRGHAIEQLTSRHRHPPRREPRPHRNRRCRQRA